MKKALLLLLAGWITLGVQAETIKDIRIVNQAGESYDISSVSAFTSFSVGEVVTSRDVILSSIAVDVNRMRKSGRYSYVNARMDVEADGVILVYTVVSKNRLNRIEIVGGKKSGRKIRKKSELEIGQFADDSTFEIAAAKIKEAYRDYWYPDTEVTWESKVNDELGIVDVKFIIDSKEKLAIKKIKFEGENNISDRSFMQKVGVALTPSFMREENEDEVEAKALKSQMQQKEKKWYSFITGSGKYKEEVVDADVFSIKSFYMNNGFLDVKVEEPRIDDSNPKRSKLYLTIDEGKRYRIGDVALSGMENFEERELRRGIRLRRGQIASYENIEAASE
jgi:outer membrane protein insertion porin family